MKVDSRGNGVPQWVLCYIPGYSLHQIGPFTLLMMAIHHQTEVTHNHQGNVRVKFWMWDTAGPSRFWPSESGVKCASGSLMCRGQSCAANRHTSLCQRDAETECHFLLYCEKMRFWEVFFGKINNIYPELIHLPDLQKLFYVGRGVIVQQYLQNMSVLCEMFPHGWSTHFTTVGSDGLFRYEWTSYQPSMMSVYSKKIFF